MKNRIIIHADFDYFYAQCEEIRKPQLRTVPVAVCVFSDRGGDSGAIATANYTARSYGVKAGMSITIAKRKLESKIMLVPNLYFYQLILKLFKNDNDEQISGST